jgi:hypothetical protein
LGERGAVDGNFLLWMGVKSPALKSWLTGVYESTSAVGAIVKLVYGCVVVDDGVGRYEDHWPLVRDAAIVLDRRAEERGLGKLSQFPPMV